MNLAVVHVPVLLKLAIHYLQIDPSGTYVDCTLGDGGYSKEIFKSLTKGRLISFDCDEVAVQFVEKNYHDDIKTGRWHVVRENFSKLTEELTRLKLETVDGVVFDLGLSSRQLDEDPLQRGFSYLRTQPLDMRMDTRLGVKAEDLLKALSREELDNLFKEYGEERYAHRISGEMKKWIALNPDRYCTSDVIAALVRRVVPAGYRKGSKHPARRVFQALRIAVNDELLSLRQGLSSALSVVAMGGRIVVVSYHSLEERIVKETFQRAVESGKWGYVEPKPVRPTQEEIERNPRAASAKMRVIERIN